MSLLSFLTNVWKIFDMRKYRFDFCDFFTIIVSINQVNLIYMCPICQSNRNDERHTSTYAFRPGCQ